jgi:hypothetical protein
MNTHVVIDNYVISKIMHNGIRVLPVSSMKKIYPNVDISQFPKISMGSKEMDDDLISRIIDGIVDIKTLCVK